MREIPEDGEISGGREGEGGKMDQIERDHNQEREESIKESKKKGFSIFGLFGQQKQEEGEEKKWGKDQFVILVLAGILLLIIALPTSGGNKKTGAETENKLGKMTQFMTEKEEKGEEVLKSEENTEKGEIEEYESYLANKLEQILSEMEGAGEVKVLVTVSTSRETIVEKDSPAKSSQTTEHDSQGGSREMSETDQQEETVYEKSQAGGEKPFIVKTIQPTVEGVLVVAQGGADEKVKQNITEAIMALLKVEPHKIKIAKMKTE